MHRQCYQLMLDDRGKPVVASLRLNFDNQPCDLIAKWPIAKDDQFVLAEDCGSVSAGSTVTFTGLFCYRILLKSDTGETTSADAEYSTHSDYGIDMDDRRMYFTRYEFAIKRAAVIEFQPPAA